MKSSWINHETNAGPATCHNKYQTHETGAGVKRFIQVLPPEKTGHSHSKANLIISVQASRFYRAAREGEKTREVQAV